MQEADELDHILGNEPVIRPSAGFAARVMREVREEARTQEIEPLAFPWHRFLPGFLTALTLCLATFMVAGWVEDAGLEAVTARSLVDSLLSPTVLGVAIGLSAAVGSLLVGWFLGRPGVRRPLSF